MEIPGSTMLDETVDNGISDFELIGNSLIRLIARHQEKPLKRRRKDDRRRTDRLYRQNLEGGSDFENNVY